MARKKRSFQPTLPPTTGDQQDKPRYRDPFQATVNKKIEEVGGRFAGQGKNILYGIAAIAVLAVIVGIFYSWSSRSNAAAQAALGKAIETSQARVSDSPVPAGSTEKTFKTEKERAEAAIAEFQAVAAKFGGGVGEKAKYFVAVTRLSIDRPTAITELEGLAGSKGDIGSLAKFALAQAKADDGKPDEAAELYRGLAASDNPVVSKDTINFALAGIYEKQGKKTEAAELYYNIAYGASQAKDKDGKAIPPGQTARSAKEKLTQLDPEKAKQIPEPAADPSMGGNPFGG
jgi:hypothetical protein